MKQFSRVCLLATFVGVITRIAFRAHQVDHSARHAVRFLLDDEHPCRRTAQGAGLAFARRHRARRFFEIIWHRERFDQCRRERPAIGQRLIRIEHAL